MPPPYDLTTMLSAFLQQLWAGNVAFPVGGTSITETAGGILTISSNPTVTNTALRIQNGANLEYGTIAWNANFLNVGTVTNGGSARVTRVISAATQVLIAPGGSDNWIFGQTAATTTKLNAISCVGTGFPIIVAAGRATAQAAANASVATFTLAAADSTFEVSANVLVTTATTHTFNVECAYTDEGNTARTVIMPFRLVGDTTAVTSSVTNTNGAVPYMGIPLHIRCKASTAITLRTQAAGTYTTVAYNVEGQIRQLTIA